MGKLGLLTGLVAGYVLGARAGKERYAQIKQVSSKVWHSGPVQKQVASAKETAKTKAGRAPTRHATRPRSCGRSGSSRRSWPRTPGRALSPPDRRPPELTGPTPGSSRRRPPEMHGGPAAPCRGRATGSPPWPPSGATPGTRLWV
jgi:hypothetical protein